MILKRLVLTLKMAWFGFCNPDLLSESVFTALAKMLEIALKTASDEKPYTTHLMMGDKRIVSFWTYPGISKNPVDRITELLSEIDSLKIRVNETKDNEQI